MSKKIESSGIDLFDLVLTLCLLFFLFSGEPDVFDLALDRAKEHLSDNQINTPQDDK